MKTITEVIETQIWKEGQCTFTLKKVNGLKVNLTVEWPNRAYYFSDEAINELINGIQDIK